MNLKIMSQNVRGLRDSNKRMIVTSLTRTCKPHLHCLQETKLSDWNGQLARSVGVGQNVEWYALGALDSTGGILIAWDNTILEMVEVMEGQFTISWRFFHKGNDIV